MSSFKCPECNLTNWSTAISCKRCGYVFQPMENIPSAETHNPVNQFEEYQPQSIADFSTPNNQYQQNWAQNQAYAGNYQQSYQSNYQPANQKTGMAIASMVLGIIGSALICIGGFILAPIGLILGIISLVKANKYPNDYGGKGFAIAGVVLCSLLTISFPMIAAIAIPNLLAARRSANEGSAISSIRTISGAEDTYRATIGTTNCGDLTQLAKNNMIDSVLASGTKSGYRFVLTATPNGCEIYATPMVAKGVSATGIRSFYSSSDEGWIIHAGNKNGLMADKNDLPIDSGNLPRQTNPPPKIAQQK
jgi:type IV pilus assembly protein PilA